MAKVEEEEMISRRSKKKKNLPLVSLEVIEKKVSLLGSPGTGRKDALDRAKQGLMLLSLLL